MGSSLKREQVSDFHKWAVNDILNEISSTGFRINFSKFKEYDQMDHLINVCITAMFIGSKYNRFKNSNF